MNITAWRPQECISFTKKMSLNSKLFFILFFLFLTPQSLWAEPSLPSKGSFTISSDSYKTNADQSADLEGNVRVVRETEVLTCDRARINNVTGDVLAEGHVVLISLKDYIRAEKMTYNFVTKTGVVYKGLIQTGQETIEGDEITRIGENEYVAKDASYTSCVNCPPSWKLYGSKIDANVGGYAFITQPVIRLYNIPVFWLPWIAIPIKNERQSGLLTPTFSKSGSGGVSIGESYFWDINKSQDATLFETYFEKRGFKHGLEYRFVSSKESSGVFRGNFLNDKLFPNTTDYSILDSRYVPTASVTRDFKPDLSRFSMRYKQHVDLPEGFTNNVNLNLVRDTRYLYDFPDDMPFAGDSALENRITLTKNMENSHASADVDLYQNLLKTDPTGQNDDAIHRAPEIKYSIIPQKIGGPVRLGLDVNYVNFARAGKTFDDSQSVDLFSTSTSSYRTGQRLITHPVIYIPLNLWDVFDVVPQAEYEETYYQFGYSPRPTTARRYLRASINTKTRFSGIIGEDEGPLATKYKHEIIPEITYSVVPLFYQEDHPFFGIQNQNFQPIYTSNQPITEFDNLQFDYRDRLADRNIITFGITNKFIRKRIESDGVGQYREILLHKLTQSYDISSSNQPDELKDKNSQPYHPIKQPFGEIRSLLELKLDYFTTLSDVSYYPYENKTNSGTSVAIRDKYGNGFGIGYSQAYQITPNYIIDVNNPRPPVIFGARSEAATASVYFKSTYLDIAGSTSYDILKSQYTDFFHGFASFALNGILKPPGKCWGFAFNFTKVFGGEQVFTVSLPIFFGEGKNFDMNRPAGI